MGMIPDEIVEQVRDGADLVGIIGESVELKRTGGDYRGPCPFHGGSHRNFAVIPKKGRYYCFVCQESGDVFSWYMKRLGMDYPTAVRQVAQRMGIVIPEQAERSGPDPREPLYSAVAAAEDWFTRQFRELPEADTARRYVEGRGYDLEHEALTELGYAPRGNLFGPAMAQLGIKEAVLLEAGLLVRRDDGSLVPRFRGRLLFPIHDLRGRVVGFGGRLLGPGEPKYLNSPETPIFRKGTLLYNLHQAKQAIRKEQTLILVEGYFDVLRLVTAGLEHVVAPLGTALTPDQAALLKRFAPKAVLLLDSDTAGLKATFRAADELLRHEVRVYVATMPEGEDPDTLVQRGGLAALTPIIHDAVDVIERKIQILDQRGWFSGIEHRRDALDRLLPTIRATRDPITRELYLSRVAERADVTKAVLEQEVAAGPVDPRPSGHGSTPSPGRPTLPLAAPEPRADGARAERQLLALMLAAPGWRERARNAVRPEWFEAPQHRAVFDVLAAQREPGVLAPPEGLASEAQAVWARLLESVARLAGQNLDVIFEGACQRLEARPLLQQLGVLSERIRLAAAEQRSELIAEREAMKRDLRARFPQEYFRYSSRQNLRGRRAPGRATPGS